MRKVFVDTGAFVALRNRAEKEHAIARRTLRDLVEEKVPLFTSNLVFAETYTVLLVRVSRAEAIEWGRRLRSSESVELVRVDQDIEEDAWAILEAQSDKSYSYIDATSFALMEKEGCGEAFAFDQHFRQRGLRIVP